METKVILPDAMHFPDAYDRTEAAAETLFQRVCNHMQVDQERIKLEIFPDETEEVRETSRWGIAPGRHAVGLHIRDEAAEKEEDRVVIALRSMLLKDPFVLVAAVAHELGIGSGG
jgi:Co/Zn/Cd efflux system component